MDNGTLISLEGVDGSGTTSLAHNLREKYDAVFTQEPTDMWTGEILREALSNESDTAPLSDFYLFMADRVHHIENRIEPAVRDGEMVICDRYADSTRAYQQLSLEQGGFPDGYALQYIEYVMAPFIREPDLTLWLDVDVGTSFERVSGDEKFEQQAEFQERVRENYETLYEENSRIVRIDANQSKRAVLEDAIAEIETLK